MDGLGYAEDPDRRAASKGRGEQRLLPLRNPMTDDLRRRLLLTWHPTSPNGELFEALSVHLAALYPQPPLGSHLGPRTVVDDPAIQLEMTEPVRLRGREA